MTPALLALGLGAAGGLVFREVGLPLPWMLGALAANLLASLFGARPKMPVHLRAVMVGVLGLMLGSAFSPAMLEQVGRWPAGMAAVLAYVLLGTGILALSFRRLAGYDPATAYFSAAPGGLTEMILTGTAMGGDERTISLTHAMRIVLVVFTVPFAFRLFGGYQGGGGGMPASLGRLADLNATDAAVLAACAVAGHLAARAIRMPAA
ncbi:MAG: AbrB family transcriptional regulator, partial [Alphaproteobacteria bacterium]|nr:AbrB family transcriptional regulator [Alphaproteobacteria bacterium]